MGTIVYTKKAMNNKSKTVPKARLTIVDTQLVAGKTYHVEVTEVEQ